MIEEHKITVETRWDVASGIIDQRVIDSRSPTDAVVSLVINTKEEQIARALHQLGWTPPPTSPVGREETHRGVAASGSAPHPRSTGGIAETAQPEAGSTP